MNKIQISWKYNDRIIHEDQVRIREADDYIRAELLEPTQKLYRMISVKDTPGSQCETIIDVEIRNIEETVL